MSRRSLGAVAVAVCLLLAGCPAFSPVDEGGNGGLDPGAGGVAAADHQVTVAGVVDGDTIEIRYPNGTVVTARLIGVDTPETHVPVDPPEFGVENTTAERECLRAAGHDATRFTTRQLLAERVGVSFDPNLDRRGYYGRLLVYVVTDDGTHNYDLIESGHARVYESAFADRDRYAAAAERARTNGTGVWRCAAGGDGPRSGAGGTATDGATATGGSLAVVGVTADPAGPDGENLNGETVTLENVGGDSLALDGWTLADAAGHEYTFSEFTLTPGERVTVHTGSGTDTATDRYWGAAGPIWNNDGDTVIVRSSNGTVVAEYEY